jgi:hypothetical protein
MDVFRKEIESVGFTFAGEIIVESLSENYMLSFTK